MGMQLIFFLRRITKVLYRYRGLSRLADLVRKAYMRKKRTILIDDFDETLFFNCALDEHISSQVFWRGAYSTGQLMLLGKILKEDMVFFDIGANKGEFTVFAAKRLGKGRVFAFEPVKGLCIELKANVTANHFQQVDIVNKGLGNSNTQAVIFNAEKKYDHEINWGTYSIYRRKGVDHPSGTIELMKLDDFVNDRKIAAVDIMKIDIEGAELEMLRGAEQTIRRFKPVIFIEINEVTSSAAGYHSLDILAYLANVGYRLELIGRNGTTKTMNIDKPGKFQNVICLPEK